MADSRLKYSGALLECFVNYPQFADDFDFLVEKGYLKQLSPDKCEWLKSKTSLGEYFVWIGKGIKGTTGGRWKTIGKVFGKDIKSVTRLAYRYKEKERENENNKQRTESIDLETLKRDLPPYRKKLYQNRREKKALKLIKTLVRYIDEKKSDEIHVIYKKIQNIFLKNVGKK